MHAFTNDIKGGDDVSTSRKLPVMTKDVQLKEALEAAVFFVNDNNAYVLFCFALFYLFIYLFI